MSITERLISLWGNNVEGTKVVTVPETGHGNPAAAMAEYLKALGLLELDEKVELVMLKKAAKLASIFHRVMTANGKAAETYSQNSENLRTNGPSKIFGRLLFLELLWRLRSSGAKEWTVIQEHILLGASVKGLEMLGVKEINIPVPDVFPKESAIKAAERIKSMAPTINLTFLVWNQEACDELKDKGLKCVLVDPPLKHLLNRIQSSDKGAKTIIKSSGSGIPKEWLSILAPLAYKNDIILHTPSSFTQRDIVEFYGSIGRNIRYIVSYPSEMVQVVHILRGMEIDVKLIALPPRGKHEVRNLEYAQKMGYLHSVLRFDSSENTDALSGYERTNVADLSKVISG